MPGDKPAEESQQAGKNSHRQTSGERPGRSKGGWKDKVSACTENSYHCRKLRHDVC